ncbi:MAG TPA: PAS domain-containing sensor histidine kinase, partial [Thermoanaerobaculia bacterium]|nr:PAS domain-containing sensor histidine kinase [Thermoanaerobaculia bacterium]
QLLIGQPIQRSEVSDLTKNVVLDRLAGDDDRGEAGENEEIEVRNSDGARLILQVNSRQLKNRRGEIVGCVGAAQDVTRQRRLQEKVSKLTSEIGAVLHAYTHTLTMLAQTMEPVAEFLGPDPFERAGGQRGAAQVIGRADVAPVLAELEPRAARLTGSLQRVLAFQQEPGRDGAWPRERWEVLSTLEKALQRPVGSLRPEVAHAYYREIAQGILNCCHSVKAGHLPRETVRQLEHDSREIGRVTCLLSLASVQNAVVEMDSQVRSLRENLTLEQREEKREDVAIIELVHAAVAIQAEYLFLRDIELRNRLAEVADFGKWYVHGSRRDLVRAVSNLLHNAIKYSWSRVGEGARPWIDLSATVGRGWVVISIENWGVPIPREEEPLVFELGYRGRFSADRNRAGTGVGLHDSREVARSHRGDIEIHSRPAYPGAAEDYSRPFVTTVTLTLPIFRKDV